jgi:outer membrane lipoprotein-sorting protein
MKIFFQAIILVLAACVCLGWAESWEALRQNSGDISSITADFTQEKHLKILARPLISKGVFMFQAPDSLRWEYTTPVKSLLLMHRGEMRKFVQQNNKLVESHTPGMDAMEVVSREISQWLAGNFNDNPTFDAELKPGRMIIMTPKNKGLAQLISKIELQLAKTAGLMESVSIYEGKDSFTKLVFSHAVLNKDIPETRFTRQ